jgi:hypothetical protein
MHIEVLLEGTGSDRGFNEALTITDFTTRQQHRSTAVLVKWPQGYKERVTWLIAFCSTQ